MEDSSERLKQKKSLHRVIDDTENINSDSDNNKIVIPIVSIICSMISLGISIWVWLNI